MVDKIKIEFGANAHLECSIAHATQRSETMWEGERAREEKKRGEKRSEERVQSVRGGKLILKFIGTGINLLNTKGTLQTKWEVSNRNFEISASKTKFREFELQEVALLVFQEWM